MGKLRPERVLAGPRPHHSRAALGNWGSCLSAWLLSTVQDWPPGFWGMTPSWHLHVGLREDVPMKSWWGVAQDLGRQKRVAAFVH